MRIQEAKKMQIADPWGKKDVDPRDQEDSDPRGKKCESKGQKYANPRGKKMRIQGAKRCESKRPKTMRIPKAKKNPIQQVKSWIQEAKKLRIQEA